MTKSVGSLGFLLAICVSAARAEAEACPITLPIEFATCTIPEGWTLRQRSLSLSSVGMLHGPHDGSGYLKPTATKVGKMAGKQEVTSTWDFSPAPHYDRWYFCEYGDVVELFRKVDANASRCTIVSAREGNAITAMRIACTLADPRRR